MVGLIFGLGLMISGMTRRIKIMRFLQIGKDWDPSLLFVLGAGVLVNLITFNYMIRVRYILGLLQEAILPWERSFQSLEQYDRLEARWRCFHLWAWLGHRLPLPWAIPDAVLGVHTPDFGGVGSLFGPGDVCS